MSVTAATTKKKRAPSRVPLAQGDRVLSPKKFVYITQKHGAKQVHYDFRLALHGALKSWSIPKGPTVHPGEKRLAVEVEDQPLEHAKFEGVIPEGEEGAGTVMLWDKGTWQPIGDPEKGYEDGKIEFLLHGEKLKGQWVLMKMKTHGKKPNWMLVKVKDRYANMLAEDKLLNTKSVKTGRTLDEIAKSKK